VTIDDAIVEAVKEDPASARLDAPTRALVDYALKVTRAAHEVTDDDVAALRAHGFSDTGILEATEIVGLFNSINRIADALDVELDPGMPGKPR
jgi:uncharacterized peroxidase-related enzyme